MPRRAAANRREVQPDSVYNNRLVTQLINKVLLDGKKATAERIVYTAFEMVAEKSEDGDALATFKKAMDNIQPDPRGQAQARWWRYLSGAYGGQLPSFHRSGLSAGSSTSARARKEKTMAERLANEILDASNGAGRFRQEA